MKKLIKIMILGMVVGSGTTLFSSVGNEKEENEKPVLRKFKISASAPKGFIVEQAGDKFSKKQFVSYAGSEGEFLYGLTEEEEKHFSMWQTFYKNLAKGNILLPDDIETFDFIKPNLDFTSPEHDTLKKALNKCKKLSWKDFFISKGCSPGCLLYGALPLPCGDTVKKFFVFNHFLAVEARNRYPELNKFINFLAAATIVDCAILAGAAWLGYHYGLPLLSAGLQKASNWSSYEPGFKQDILKATHFGAQKVAQVGEYVSYIPAPITGGAQKIGAWGTTAGSYLPSTRNTLIGAGILGASSLLLGRRHVKNFIDEQICDVY